MTLTMQETKKNFGTRANSIIVNAKKYRSIVMKDNRIDMRFIDFAANRKTFESFDKIVKTIKENPLWN